MNPVVNPAKANIGRVWHDLVSSKAAPEPKTLPRQRRRALAYSVALKAVNEEYQTIFLNGQASYTLTRRGRRKIARAAAKAALQKGRLHLALKKED